VLKVPQDPQTQDPVETKEDNQILAQREIRVLKVLKV
jgi:hypothetical protein